MSGDFIEPIARQVRAEVAARGQSAKRVIPREAGEIYPIAPWHTRRERCPQATTLPPFHDGADTCQYCGVLIR